jgi:hypothetical protein
MREKITSDYAAGVLEKVGGFAIHKNPASKNKKYVYFKIASDSPVIKKLMAFLKKSHKIHSNSYKINGKDVFYVTRKADLDRLIVFMKKKCFRNDYTKFKL